MEWLNGNDPHKDMEVDIGFISQMELKSHCPSHAQGGKSADSSNIELDKWTKEISHSHAIDMLEQHFYPFKEVWHVVFVFSILKPIFTDKN